MENRVEELRRTYGIKQEALAAAMGVSRQSIGSIENGRYNPSTTLAIKLARYFGLRVEDVFLAEGAPTWRTVEFLTKMPEDSLTMRNRAHNADIPLPAGKLICGQGNRYPSQFSYATFMTAFNGAEPIAVYNASLMLGESASLTDILTEFDGNGLPLLDGYAGTDPAALATYFSAHKIFAERFDLQADFSAACSDGCIFVMTYWNDRFFRELKGLRTVAGCFKDGAWSFWNMKNEDQDPRTYRSLAEGLRGKKFMLGYLLKV